MVFADWLFSESVPLHALPVLLNVTGVLNMTLGVFNVIAVTPFVFSESVSVPVVK